MGLINVEERSTIPIFSKIDSTDGQIYTIQIDRRVVTNHPYNLRPPAWMGLLYLVYLLLWSRE